MMAQPEYLLARCKKDHYGIVSGQIVRFRRSTYGDYIVLAWGARKREYRLIFDTDFWEHFEVKPYE